MNLIEPDGTLIYCQSDEQVNALCVESRSDIQLKPYSVPKYSINNGVTTVVFDDAATEIMVFGKHNLMNLNGARLICESLDIPTDVFMKAIATFKGAAKRLELISKNDSAAFYKDFAHSPSKLKATIQAAKEQYPDRMLVACMELHTYSSLNSDFLQQYKDAMQQADIAVVYYSSHALEIKKMPPLDHRVLMESFGRKDLLVFTHQAELLRFLNANAWEQKNLLMMSSGGFDNLDFYALAKALQIG